MDVEHGVSGMFGFATGFSTVLKRIADVWRSRKNEVIEQSADTMRQLNEAIQPQGWQLP